MILVIQGQAFAHFEQENGTQINADETNYICG